MRRQRGYASRVLGIILIGTLVAGLFLGARKLFQSDPPADSDQSSDASSLLASEHQDQRAINSAGANPAARPELPLAPSVLVTQTPTLPAPTTKPVTPVTSIETPTPAPATQPLPILSSNDPFIDGRTAFDAGNFVQARQLLSQALASGRLPEPDARTTRDLLTQIGQATILSRKVYADDPYTLSYTVKTGDRLTTIAATNNVTWELLGRINGIADPRKMRLGQTLKLVKGPFHAVVSKSQFRMDIYLGTPGEPASVFVTSLPVGLGKDDSTPLGTWQVEPHKKLKNPTYFSPRGEGVIQADDPKNPLGEFWIGLTGIGGQALGKQSYGIHGTIEPDSIGKQESMGCIRLRNDDIALVFELLVEGKSTVLVKE